MGFDYLLNINKNGKVLISLGGKYFNYDNYTWDYVGLLIDNGDKFKNKKDIIKFISENQIPLFEIKTKGYLKEFISCLDLSKKTITNPNLSIYSIDEYNDAWDCCWEIFEKDGIYYHRNTEYNELYEISKVNFENEIILKKQVLSYDEVNLIREFISTLYEQGEMVYLLNNLGVIHITEI